MATDDIDPAAGADFRGARLLGRYVVGDRLAEGGMGAVYLARDEALDGKTVVVKVPHARFLADSSFRERFEREIRDLLALEHPHVVRILAKGEHAGVPFFVLAYLRGGSLRDKIRSAGGRQVAVDVAAWLPDVAQTLDFIHGHGVVHRDVKPANVLFDEHGHVFVSDFGLAKALGSRDTGLTQTGATPGSPAYMAPEVVFDARVGPAYDQYALAVVVYEALSGSWPHGGAGEAPARLLFLKAAEPPRPLASAAPEVPAEVARVVERGLSRDPAKRFGSCREFADAFVAAAVGGEVRGRGSAAAPPAPPPRAPASAAEATRAVGPPDVVVRAGPTSRGEVPQVSPVVSPGPEDREPPPVRAAGARTTRGRAVPVAPPARGGRRGLLVGVLLAAVLGGGAYVAGTRGLSGGAQDSRETAREPDAGRRALPPPIEPPPPPPAPAPWLEWVGPAEGAVVRARRVEVAGRVADLRRGRLTVGGVETTVGADGGFATHVDVTTPGPLAVHVRFEPTGGTRLEDVRTVTVEFPPPVVTVRRPAEGERLPSTTVDVEASVEPSETAVVTANGRPLTLVGSTARGTVTLHDHGPGRITVEAKAVGVPAVSRSVDVVVEPPPAPVLAVVEPRDGAEVEDGPVRVSGTVRGAWKDVVRVNGASIRLVAGAFSTTVEPADLGPLDVVVECDADGRPVVTRTVQVDVVPAALGLEIDAPAAGDFVTTKTLRVRGTIRGAPSGPVLVGGVVASVRGTEFTADVPVGADGPTTVVATARRRRGPDARAEVAVVVDRTPPRVVVEDPAGLEGTATKDAGRLRGRVHDEHATAVQVDDRSFDLDDGGTFSLTVPVAPGKRRTVVLRARDRAGNESKPVRVEFRGSGPRILSVPGEFATVAAAVEAAQAGETVEIGAGTYREQIVVRRPVTLAGAGRDTVRIEAAQTDVPVIRVARTKDVVVRGLTVVGRGSPSDASSDLDGVTWTKDWAPTVDMVEPGSPAARAGIAAGAVLVRVGDRAVERLDHLQLDVLDRSIRSESFDQPLRFSNGAVATVRYRRVSWAMRIDDAEASLQDVAFEATSCGALLVAGPSASARIHEVRIESGEDGIYVGGGAFAQIRDGRFSGLDGAAITAFGDRTRVRVADCVASRLRGAGFRVMGAVAAQVERCRATECVYGLDVLGPGSTSPVSANVDVSACTFSRNRVTGINFDAVAVGTIEGNTCEDNAGHGIDTCGAGTRPLIRRNTCRRNGSYGVVH